MTVIPPEAHISYLFQHRKCGKCAACREGAGHGPYFYARWREGRSTKSKSLGKTLNVEIVRAYFSQVFRLSAKERQTSEPWERFKMKTLGQHLTDDDLSQEHLRILALKCKEQCLRKALPSSGMTMIPKQQTAVA